MVAKAVLGHLLKFGFDLFSSFLQSVLAIITWPVKTALRLIGYIVDFVLSKSKSTIQKCLFVWTILVMLGGISLMLYAAFYAAYVPTAKISRPVHLSFKPCETGTGICSFPTGNITFWNDERTFQEVLGSGQAYSMVLEMDMPDSHANRNLGMFMVLVKMYDREGYISATSQRSTLYKYRSIGMRVIDLILLSPFYFFGFLEQQQTLIVEMFSHYVDDYYHPSVGATVEVQSHRVEIYSITLKLFAKFTGLKYFLYYWPIVSAVCAFWVNLFILGTGFAIVLYHRSESVKKMAGTFVGNESNPQISEADSSSRLGEDSSDDSPSSSVGGGTDEKLMSEQGTQTKASEDDLAESYDLPLVQEPADFDVLGAEEFDTELRHRRIN